MINEWEQEIDWDDNDLMLAGKPRAPEVGAVDPASEVQVVTAKDTTTPIVATPPKVAAPPVFTEKKKKKKKTGKESDLKAIEERWAERLDQAAATRDAVDQDANPQLWEWENQIWAQDQMQYVNEWNERAGDTADFEWDKRAKDILEKTTADYTSKYGMSAPQTAPTDTGASTEPEKAEAPTPPAVDKAEMIRTAIAAPEKGRLKGLKMRPTTAQGEQVRPPMTIERAAELRAQESGDLDINIKAAQDQIAELDTQIAEAREAGDQERVDALVNTRHQQQGQLDPMLKTQGEFEASFRQRTLNEQVGSRQRIRMGPLTGTGIPTVYAPLLGLSAIAAGRGESPAGGVGFEPTLDELTEAAHRGLMTTSETPQTGLLASAPTTTGRKYAPVLPAEIVMGRRAGAVVVYRHTDTGEELRINPADFHKEWNADHLQTLKAGKLERLGFERVEDPGTSYTDVNEKVVLASVRVLHRLNQLEARIDQLEGDPDSEVTSLIKQEQARAQELHEERRRVINVAGAAGPDLDFAGEAFQDALHEAAPGTIRNIQDLQRELVNLNDLKERLTQIHTVTLGGYSPTKAQMDKYLGEFKDEPLPGTAGASKQAKANLRAARKQEQE